MKNKKIILGSLAIILAIGTFTLNMIGCSGDSNEPKEIEQIAFQKRVDGFERGKSVEFYKNAMDRINGNSKRLYDILRHRSVISSDVIVTQELLNELQNETGIVVDLPLENINQILQETLGFMTEDVDLLSFVGGLGFSSATNVIFNQIIINNGIEDLYSVMGFFLLPDNEKEFLDLSNYIVRGADPVYGIPGSSNVAFGCSIEGYPAPCSLVLGLAGAGLGSAFGPIGTFVGGAIGFFLVLLLITKAVVVNEMYVK